MICSKCGAPLEEGDLFCESCGTKVDVTDSQMNTDEAMGQTGVEDDMPNNMGADMTDDEPSVYPQKKKSPLKAILITVVALALIGGGVFAGMKFLPQVLKMPAKGNEKASALIYMKDNELMQYAKKGNVSIDDHILEDKNGIASMSGRVLLSEDGKTIYYPRKYESNQFDLYKKSLKDTKSEEEKVDSNVFGYQVLSNGKILYLKDIEKRVLYLSDGKGEKEKIATQVSFFSVSEDEKTILWKAGEEKKLYYIDATLKQEKIKIDSNVDSVRASESLDTIYYQKEDKLYCVYNFGEKIKLAGDVSWWATLPGENKDMTCFYAVDKVRNMDPFKYFLKDDLGKDRDSVNYRNNVRAFFDGLNSQTLYAYQPSKGGNELASGFIQRALGRNGLLYWVVQEEDIEKIKLSEIQDNAGIPEKKLRYSESQAAEYDMTTFRVFVDMALDDAGEAHFYTDGKDIAFDLDADEYILRTLRVYSDSDSKNLYYKITSTEDSETLFKQNISQNPSQASVLAGGLDEDAQFEDIMLKDGGLYYLSMDGESGDLYFEDTKIDTDVYEISWLFEDGDARGIAYMKDLDDEEVGTLKTYDGSKTEKISDDVYSYNYQRSGNGDIAYLVDWNNEKNRGDLKLYSNGKSKDIDIDVKQIVYFE